MTKRVLTAAAVEKLKAAKGRREIPDGLYGGLYLVIQPSGKKSWALRYRIGGRTRKFTFGGHSVGLGDARKLAKAALESIDNGRDPAMEKRDEQAVNADALSVEDACGQFIRLHCRAKKLRSWRDTARRMGLKPDPKNENRFDRTGNGVVGAWKGRLIGDIKKRDVRARLDTIAEKFPVAANLELAILRKFFGWCVERDIVSQNPCANIKPPSASVGRDRVLIDDELKMVWTAAEKVGWPFGRFVQLLILTGQRRDEVAQMRWCEIDEGTKTWTIPSERRKNKKPQIVPLSDSALAIIQKLPHVKGDAGYVFTTSGRSPVSGYSKWKTTLDDTIRDGDGDVEPWRLHDLRRTLATGLQRLGVRLEVTEAVLGHTSGSRAGIVGIYQRHDWASEKRAALDAWAAHVLGLGSADAEQPAEDDAEQSNVVQMRAVNE